MGQGPGECTKYIDTMQIGSGRFIGNLGRILRIRWTLDVPVAFAISLRCATCGLITPQILLIWKV